MPRGWRFGLGRGDTWLPCVVELRDVNKVSAGQQDLRKSQVLGRGRDRCEIQR